MVHLARGRLSMPSDAPGDGEAFRELADLGGVVIEEIVSSAHPVGGVYDQPGDEWVVVLDGAAALEVGEERIELTAGDWLVIPAHQRHRVASTTTGTRWLAVHAPAASSRC